MASILVVDDHPVNRLFLVMLLERNGHAVLEASNGVEALALARTARPDLIITDIAMPSMDGLEFANRLHGDASVAQIPIIFYSSTYTGAEARALARAAGVHCALSKPASAGDILKTVDAALAGLPVTAPAIDAAGTDANRYGGPEPPVEPAARTPISRPSTDEVWSDSPRMAALIELGMELASERDPVRLLDRLCRATRRVLGAHFAAAGLAGEEAALAPFVTSGVGGKSSRLRAPLKDQGITREVLRGRVPLRLTSVPVELRNSGFPGLSGAHMTVRSFMAAPFVAHDRVYGILYLAGKTDGGGFTQDDERIAGTLASQFAIAYENARLYTEIRQRAEGLEQEIQDRRRVEAALRESEERFRQVAEAIEEVFWMIDGESRNILYISPAYEKVWGRSCASLYAQADAILDAVHPGDRDILTSALEQERQTGSYSIEYRIVRPDGAIRWIWDRAFPIHSEDGGVKSVAGIAQDITDHKNAEIALQNERDFSAAVVDTVRSLVVVLDINAHIVRFNRACEQLTGYSSAEVLGRNALDFLCLPDQKPALTQLFHEICEGDYPRAVEAPWMTRDGRRPLIAWSTTALTDGSGKVEYVVASGTDVTEYRQAAKAMEERARLAALSADVGVALTRNDELPVMLHRCAEALVQHLDAALSCIWTLDDPSPALAQQAGAGLDTYIAGDGSAPPPGRFEVEVIAQQRRPCVSNDLAADGRCLDHEWARRHGIEAFAGYPLMVAGRLVGVTGMFTRHPMADVTTSALGAIAHEIALGIERARTEEALRRSRDELEQRVVQRTAEVMQSKIEAEAAREAAELARHEAESANRAKSEFLSRMSHELRTPMNSILGFAQIMEMHASDQKQAERVGHIIQAGRHLLQLINEVLDMARVETNSLSLTTEPVSVRHVLSTAVELARPLCTQFDLSVVFDPAECDGLYVSADQQRLSQVLLNLLSNASKYNRRGGEIRIACEKHEGKLLHISITDTGPGIAPENLEKVFLPFERLGAENSAIEGTGLGLALSRRLVEAMGGAIRVDSTPDEGSTFRLELLLTEAHAEPAHGVTEPAPIEFATSRTILCIEDNPANLKVIEHALANHTNIRLISAMQGQLGIDLARRHQPDLILLDVHLPDLSGDEVLRRLKAGIETRHLTVLILSADATSSQINHMLQLGAKDYLTKPLDIRQFLSVISHLTEQDEAI